jgi:hypothetical protein
MGARLSTPCAIAKWADRRRRCGENQDLCDGDGALASRSRRVREDRVNGIARRGLRLMRRRGDVSIGGQQARV